MTWLSSMAGGDPSPRSAHLNRSKSAFQLSEATRRISSFEFIFDQSLGAGASGAGISLFEAGVGKPGSAAGMLGG
jgi:hypothetical protein